VVGTLLGLEMVYRLDPSAVDERSVVAALRGILRACDDDRDDALLTSVSDRPPMGER
jgi:hypothetical protein